MATTGVLVLMVILVILNVFAAAAGLALFALAIWVAVDPYKLYPIAAVSGKDDIFAAAWIAIFTGFAYFCTAVFGIYAALKRKRSLMLLYLILMFIIFIFECASCITAVTNRDYLVGNSNLVKNQMLKYYAYNSDQGNKITLTWNKVMQDIYDAVSWDLEEAFKIHHSKQVSVTVGCVRARLNNCSLFHVGGGQAQCCGTDSPLDWMEYNSTFRQAYGSAYPWPLNCCQRQSSFDVNDPTGCKFGQTSAVYTKGCFNYIQSVFNSYTWSISWYGFAVQMFVFFLLLIAIVYFILLDN